MEALTGRLLVATPSLEDPNFDRTVILLLQHDEVDGAMGLVLNRPSGLPIEEELGAWGEKAAPPDEVFIGGPVQPEVAIALGWLAPGHEAPEGVQPVLDDRIGVVDLRRQPADMPELTAVRVFAGYAGWGGGQLEHEIERGDWFVVDARADDVFSAAPDALWGDVLHRQGGTFRTISPDPTLN